MNEEKVKENFIDDVKNHEMIVKFDNGLYRHLRFKKPLNYNQSFEIMTWPGKLVISGDMGDYMFTCIDDMFEFFRGGSLSIEPGYWSQKCISQDVNSGIREFDGELLVSKLKEWIDNNYPDFLEDTDFQHEFKRSLLDYEFDNEYQAMESVLEFEWNGQYIFQEFWEIGLKSYTYRYLWCLYAIVWGIQKYDMYKTGEMK